MDFFMIDEQFLDKTIEYWQPFSKDPLTREDAREIISNVSMLFDLLDEIAEENTISLLSKNNKKGGDKNG